MKQFRFRLQSSLDIANQRERNIKSEFAKAKADERSAEWQLDRTLKLWQRWGERIRQNQRGRLDSKLIQEQLRVASVLQERAIEKREMVRAAQKATEQVRARLAEAARWRKGLERLRGRMQQEHNAEVLAQETKASDDLATARVAAGRSLGARDATITGVPS